MARRYGTATTEGEISLTAATAKTVLQLVAPSAQDIALIEGSISFDGISATDAAVQVDLLIQTTAGTSSAGTPVKNNRQHGAIQTASRITITAEPTASDVLRRWDVHPQSGRDFPLNLSNIVVAAGERIGLRCTAPANVNCLAWISWEE